MNTTTRPSADSAGAWAPASVSELGEAVRDASSPLRIHGSGTWLQGAGPWAPATPLTVRALRGVVEYIPGDLVVTVRAGTTLAELDDITGEHAQMLALTPYGSRDGTIGALVATASAAPLPFADLTVRDLVLGVQVVTGEGACTRAGGRVVKNVAGFDLVRLHTGAFGTLGVITEVSLRLHARPLHDVLVRAPLCGPIDDVIPRLVMQRAPIPMLLELAPGRDPVLWARCSGNEARAASLEQRVRGFGVAPSRLARWSLAHDGRAPFSAICDTPHDAIVLRARTPLSDAVPFVRAARDAFPDATLRYDPNSGSLRVTMPASGAGVLPRDIDTLYRLAAGGGAMHTISVAIDQGPREVTSRTPLDAQIKRALDPRDILNPLAS